MFDAFPTTTETAVAGQFLVAPLDGFVGKSKTRKRRFKLFSDHTSDTDDRVVAVYLGDKQVVECGI